MSKLDQPKEMPHDEVKVKSGFYCRDGVPYCRCRVGYPYEEMCADCRDERSPSDIYSRCVCGPEDELQGEGI